MTEEQRKYLNKFVKTLYKDIKMRKISHVDAARKYLKELRQMKSSDAPYIELAQAVRTFFYFRRIHNKLFLYLSSLRRLDLYGLYTPDMSYLENIFKLIDYHVPKSKYSDIEIIIRAQAKGVSLSKVRQQNRYLVPCKNCIYDRKINRTISYSHYYFFQTKINTSYPSKHEYVKDKNTILKQLVGNDTNLTGMNRSQLNESVAQFAYNFINNISNYNKDTRRQLEQEFLDCLEPYLNRGKLIINLGETGNNGKSNYTQLMTGVIGKDNVSAARIDQLSDKNALSSIQTAMAIISDDLGDHLKLKDDSNLKAITTGGSVYVDPKYKNGYTGEFHLTIVQNANKLPKFQGKGSYISRRILIIPFEHHFTRDDKNHIPNNTILQILRSKSVREYFLYKILHQPKFLNYHMSGESRKLLMNFESQNDSVKEFCISTDLFKYQISRFPRMELFRCFEIYARQHNFKQINSREFYNRFKFIAEKHGYVGKNAKFNNYSQIFIIKDYMKHAINKVRNIPQLNHTYRCYVNPNYTNNSYHQGNFDKKYQASINNRINNKLYCCMNQYRKTHHTSQLMAAINVYKAYDKNDANPIKTFLNNYILKPIITEQKKEIHMENLENHQDLPF